MMGKLELEKQYKTEAELLRVAKKWLEQQPDVLVMPIRDRYVKGYSDLFLCVGGMFVAIELKDDVGTASRHQIEFIEKVVRHNGIGGICRTLGDIIQYVEGARRICRRLTAY